MTEQTNRSISNWRNVPDWCFLALGVVLVVIAFAMETTEPWSAAILGTLMVLAALWDLASPSIAAVWAEGIVAFIVFLIPWFSAWLPNQYSGAGSWVTWAVGVLGMICAAWSWASHTDSN